MDEGFDCLINAKLITFVGKKYLNSGLYIGYLDKIISLINYILENQNVAPYNSDQNHFHHVYINDTLRTKFGIKLDHKSKIVYNIFQAEHEGEIQCQKGTFR